MKYDFEIAVPTEVNNKIILGRIKDMKKYGFVNYENYKVRLVLLASKDNSKEPLLDGWPSNFDVDVQITPFTYVAQRIYHYYDEIIQPDIAKWYVRIDEDTLTDIKGLATNLERLFDHEKDYHVVGLLNWDIYDVDETILNSLGYGHWYRHHPTLGDTPPHEHEISVTSNAAVSKMLANPHAQAYFKMRKEFAEGYGDHGMCHCLRMCKIYPTEVKFLTHEPELCNFSQFGGFRNHIHWVSRDKSPKIMTWLDIFNRNAAPEDENTCLLGKTGEEKRYIRLCKDKTVRNIVGSDWCYRDQVVGLWCKHDDKLVIYTDNEEDPLLVFNQQDKNLYKFENFELKKITSR